VSDENVLVPASTASLYKLECERRGGSADEDYMSLYRAQCNVRSLQAARLWTPNLWESRSGLPRCGREDATNCKYLPDYMRCKKLALMVDMNAYLIAG
jgi:hypothetical protein